MKSLKRKWINLGVLLILAVGLIGSSWLSLIGKAASCTFSVSGDEVEIGETFTLTLSCTEEGATLVTYMGDIVYDPTYLEYQGDASSLKNIVENEGFKEISLTFKALKAGTTTVKFEFTDSALGETPENPIVEMTATSNPGTVTITEPTTEAPTTEPPTTEAPSTEPPTTEPPTTEAPTPPPTTQPPERPSSNAFLDDMSVYPGTLSPAFDPNEMYYDVTVGYDVTKITVDAVTADVDAVWKINVWGSNDNLQVGKNIIDIKVTAADGTVKWYAIFVYREAPPTTEAPEETTTDQPIEPPTTGDQPTEPPMTENQPTEEDSLQIMIGSVTGRVQETLGAVARPEGFEEVTYTFNGVQVEALKGIGKDLLLLPVSDGTETKLYIYDADKNGFYPYVGIQITSALYTVIPFEAEESIPEGYRLSTVNYEGTLIDAWVRNDAVDSTYAVFYAMNWDGVISLYRFDAGEKTLQRVNKWELSVSKEPGTSSGSNEQPGQTEAPGSSEAPTVNGDYIDYYEETLKKINRRDTFMFIIMVLMLASMLAMYLLFVVGDKKDQTPEGDGPEDDPDEEYIEEEYSDEDDEYYVDDEDDVSDEDVTDEDVAADEDEEKQIQEELASIVAGMADFMADVDKTSEEKNTKEDIDDLELEDLDLDDIE